LLLCLPVFIFTGILLTNQSNLYMNLFKNLFSGNNSGNTNPPAPAPQFSPGDIFYIQEDKQYYPYKLLVIDEEFECYHLLRYEPVASLPAPGQVNELEVAVYHSPFDKKAFAGAILLTNTPVVADDLIGYHEYLRQTQEPEYYLPIAKAYYLDGYNLTTEKQFNKAIDAYSKAIDLAPYFYQAIDNRAFVKMDTGNWEEAIEDFKLSLAENPNSMLAEFSIGECYFKMGDYPNAKVQFEKAHAIDPTHKTPIHFLEQVNAILNK
jgi:tetratricopeptide (TPR) repeat protein